MEPSATYIESRDRFLSEAKASAGRISEYVSDRQDGATKLVTDVAQFGDLNSRRVLVLISGTHGVEGFCGSMCQVDALTAGVLTQLPPNLRVVLIHALNPFGFSSIRRTTEENVDLNRNFIDYRSTPPKNDAYDEIHELLVPVTVEGRVWELTKQRTAKFIENRGLRYFQNALTSGQYSQPAGLFYGGAAATWSRRTLEAICKCELASCEQVWVLDFHSGLGAPGALELILPDSKGSPMHNRASFVFGKRVKTIRGEGSDSLSAPVSGTIDECFRREFGDDAVTYLALEYGTKSIPEVLEALIVENWYFHSGNHHSAEYSNSKKNLKQAFWSDAPEWQDAVRQQSREVIALAVQHFE